MKYETVREIWFWSLVVGSIATVLLAVSMFFRTRHVHKKKLFLIGNVAFVKCTECGWESMPWEPAPDAVAAASEHHANDAAEVVAINERCKWSAY